MRTFLQSGRALSDAEIARVYALAERLRVSVGPFGGTQSPSKGPAEWAASGSVVALWRFLRAVGFRVISEPSYPKVRWTDRNRWE
jgi:hypothetical protein